jgi:hypothetical protein
VHVANVVVHQRSGLTSASSHVATVVVVDATKLEQHSNRLDRFPPDNHPYPRLTFGRKEWASLAYLLIELIWSTPLLALLSNIILGWKCFQGDKHWGFLCHQWIRKSFIGLSQAKFTHTTLCLPPFWQYSIKIRKMLTEEFNKLLTTVLRSFLRQTSLSNKFQARIS